MIDLSAWPALILSAGVATRLRPLSNVRAKAALPVAGQPLISRILRWLSKAGVRQAVINLHHRAETVTRIVGDGADWDVSVRYSWETTVLGSAGGPSRALPLLDAERFLIVNGDTLTDCDLRAVAEQHVDTGALVTMALVEKTDVERLAFVDDSDVIRRFGVRGDGGGFFGLHFIGVQAVEAAAFAAVPDDQPYEAVKQLYPRLITAHPGSVRAFRSSAEFLDVGTAADYLATVETVAAREGRGLDVGANGHIDASATIEHSILWDRVRVGPRARLTDCIVADDVMIPADSDYKRCAIVNSDTGVVVATF